MMKHDINKLKSELITIYTALLNDCNADKKLSPFLMQWGNKFPINQNEGIIFYGRATNGWFGTWDFDIFFSNDDKDRGWARDDAMQWVEEQWIESEDGYITSKSQFWRIIKEVSSRFYGNEWFQYVAWSNICKVAPSSKGNPSDSIFYKTLEQNVRIFHTELDFWSPKYIVLFTDGIKRDNKTIIDWTSYFIESLDRNTPQPIFEVIWDNTKPYLKIKVYKLGDRYFIISIHPQGRNVELHKNAIIRIIERLEE